MRCNVCASELSPPIYESTAFSITSMSKVIDGKTVVRFCDFCGHLQTQKLPNLRDYYAYEFEVNINSEEEDQIYEVVDGKPLYRSEKQAQVAIEKIRFREGARVLDYGCAKGHTLKMILSSNPSIEPFLFEVTDKYLDFWKRFPKQAAWSLHEPDPAWFGTMDVVMSFYALEHVEDLDVALDNVIRLLKPGGTFYFVVPNVYQNAADFVVADHINHFSATSLARMLGNKGFRAEIDDTVHDAAFVVTAVRDPDVRTDKPDELLVAATRKEAEALGRMWNDVVTRIRAFEATNDRTDATAIYGAGFYGNFIAAALDSPGQIACFVDRNPYLHGTELLGKPIVPPSELPTKVSSVLVGLNPRSAKENIDAISEWHGRHLTYFYI